MQFVTLKHAKVSLVGCKGVSVFDDVLDFNDTKHLGGEIDLELSFSNEGLLLIWNRAGDSSYKYHLDFVRLAGQLRSFPAAKQSGFNQALGKKTKSVIDATGGFGGDAMLMCMQGYAVTVIERLPLLAGFLDEAFNRLQQSNWAIDNQVTTPKVICGEAEQLLPDLQGRADCVYFDPMFPPKKKKNAATNKHMQLLQWLAGADQDAAKVAGIAREYFPRLAVKRPDYAAPLLDKPSVQFSSKLVHYDVYV